MDKKWGVTKRDANAKKWQENSFVLVIICEAFAESRYHNFTNRTRFVKKETATKNVQKILTITADYAHLITTCTQMLTSLGCEQ